MISNRPSTPLFATINVTGVCNLACRYCFYQPRALQVMRPDHFHRAVCELSDLSAFFVILSGGEPFTHPQIGDLIQFAHSKFRHVVVLTNGTIISPEHVRAIEGVIASKGSFPIQVSIDAIDARVNARTRCDSAPILANLRKLSELRADVVIAMVITRVNVDNLLSSIVRLSDFTRFFHLMPFQPVRALNGSDRDLELSEDEMTAVWQQVQSIRSKLGLHIDTPLDDSGMERGCASGAPCMAAFSHVVIDPNMKVRPCDRLVDVVLGDLRDSRLSEIWKGEAAMRIVEARAPLCHA